MAVSRSQDNPDPTAHPHVQVSSSKRRCRWEQAASSRDHVGCCVVSQCHTVTPRPRRWRARSRLGKCSSWALPLGHLRSPKFVTFDGLQGHSPLPGPVAATEHGVVQALVAVVVPTFGRRHDQRLAHLRSKTQTSCEREMPNLDRCTRQRREQISSPNAR